MALESVHCPVCHGSGKEPISFPARTQTCSMGFEHTTPKIIAGETTCRECGGCGTVLEVNFGRQ